MEFSVVLDDGFETETEGTGVGLVESDLILFGVFIVEGLVEGGGEVVAGLDVETFWGDF